MQLPSNRLINTYVVAIALLLLGAALYMQHGMGLQPCYLCITQRAVTIVIAIAGLAALLHNPATTRLYGAVITLLSLAGGYFSGRQLWLQSLPEEQTPACGPPADYLFDVFDFGEALGMLLQGDGNCAEVQWTLFGLSIPGWTMLAFTGFAALGILQVIRKI